MARASQHETRLSESKHADCSKQAQREATNVPVLSGQQGRSPVCVHSVPCSRRVHGVRGALASQGSHNTQRLVDRQAQRVGAANSRDSEAKHSKAARVAWYQRAGKRQRVATTSRSIAAKVISKQAAASGTCKKSTTRRSTTPGDDDLLQGDGVLLEFKTRA
jgi:hypothetical protein